MLNHLRLFHLIALALVGLTTIFSLCSTAAEPTKGGERPMLKFWQKFKKPSKDELKKKLDDKAYEVTQEEGTERPFTGKDWDNKKPGIYVDIVSGEPLFSSLDKYDSGTGWPSFTKPLEKSNITTKTDRSLFFSERTEVRSKVADSHLGHVFNDGPPDKGGLRYCMNSAAMRFVPADQLEKEGYGEYAKLFDLSANSNSPDQKDLTKGNTQKAFLAGGCFWGMEELIRQQKGVVGTRVGYTGGVIPNPTYSIVKTGTSGHAESIEVEFDPKVTTYENILRFFFRIHDPTTKNRQGNDVGTQYRSAIFYSHEEQKKIAEKVKAEVDASGKWKNPLVTEIVEAKPFYEAEKEHQDYLQRNPGGYTCHFIRD